MRIDNDKYYTPIKVANHCIDMVCEIIGAENISEVLEPSIGNGSFTHHNRLHVNTGYDIDPEIASSERLKIFAEDFLSADIAYKENRLVLGNPPFGQYMSMAQRFYKKAAEIADYIAFVLPISQMGNTRSLYAFDLIYSEDLGVHRYTDRDLHCCFNIYRRPKSKRTNTREIPRLEDISIYRQDSKHYEDRDFDIRMCYWGDGSAGKILSPGEKYSAEYKIKIHNDSIKDEVIHVLSEHDWKDMNCIAMRKIQQFHIIDLLKREVPGIR